MNDIMYGEIRMNLNELNDSELRNIQVKIRDILRDREVSENVVKQAIKEIPRGRFTDLTLKLERDGFSREAISSRVVKMVEKGIIKSSAGCPIGEIESKDNPIYPKVEGKKYIQICYVR